jgi:hypothetical protein
METFGERGDALGQAFANAYALRVRVDLSIRARPPTWRRGWLRTP